MGITIILNDEDKRLENAARVNLISLLEWWKSCYEVRNEAAADIIWKMIVLTLKESIDFIKYNYRREKKNDLFNSLIELHRSFFRKANPIPTLEMEEKWLQETVAAAQGGVYAYQWLWELLTPANEEIKSSIEQGLLKELAGRENGYQNFFDHFLVYFLSNEVPSRILKNPRSFFLFLRKDIRQKYGPRDMRFEAKKLRSFIKKGLDLYPPQRKTKT